ncbi:ABC transporter ATP-binding protein [Larsenimonas suaedae]|uniref:ABC transporter ATP-binding protein n=1 Tax=Larsenimonas suaedae TaxID=1851019 RepID=A0ABU1GX64_9GAMM|nr:ABC transporter ATP-binding protein [Larsenimonas suaedae]MCM2972988.1 ABC transporter ATP-binding protein [Larsenimonas suaedae]MDR5896425.1 ABC transporter ATP-binding protein [Larsenimonas suaedae]
MSRSFSSIRESVTHESATREPSGHEPATPTILRAVGLSKQVRSGSRTLTVIDALDLDVAPGDCLAILGRSGAGKSTLLSLLAGLDQPSGGELYLFDTALSRADEDGRAKLRAGQVGFVFQNFQLLPTLTALENVMLPLELTEARDKSARAKTWLERVGLSDRLDHLPRQLSGGEQQRVAIARAFVTEPKLVFADEPTGNLDQHTGQSVAELLFSLNRDQGTTLIVVTHDTELARQCARQLTLADGALIPWENL